MTEDVWYWEMRSPSELRSALEEYSEYVLAAGAPPDGGDPDPETRDRQWRIWAQNRVIDRAMRRLFWQEGGRLPWKALNLYYRQGRWAEYRGWVAAARAVGYQVPVCMGGQRCGVGGDDRMELPTCRHGVLCREYRARFEEYLAMAIEGLWLLIKAAQDGRRTLGVVDTEEVMVYDGSEIDGQSLP